MNGGFNECGGRSIKSNNGSPPGPWDGYVCQGDLSRHDMCFYGRLIYTFYLHNIYMISAYKFQTIYTLTTCDNYIYVYIVSTLYLHYVYIYYLQYTHSM